MEQGAPVVVRTGSRSGVCAAAADAMLTPQITTNLKQILRMPMVMLSRLIRGYVSGHRLTLFGRASDYVQMVSVNVDHLDTPFLALKRKWPIGLDGFGVINRALVMAVVQLSRAHQREKSG